MEVEYVSTDTHQLVQKPEANELTPVQIESENGTIEEVQTIHEDSTGTQDSHLEKYDPGEFKEEIKLDSDGCVWTDASTQLLLTTKMELESNKSLKYKTKKKMLEKIAEIVNRHGYKFDTIQVGNRIKTLERRYKRLVDSKKTTKTGGGKKRLNVSPKVSNLLEQMNKGKDSIHLTNIIEEDVDTPADVLNDQFGAENGIEDEDDPLPPTTSSANTTMSDHVTSSAERDAFSSPRTNALDPEIVSESSSGPSTKNFPLRQGKRQGIVHQLKLIQKDRAEFQMNLLQRMDDYNIEKKRSNDLMEGTNMILTVLVNNSKIQSDNKNEN